MKELTDHDYLVGLGLYKLASEHYLKTEELIKCLSNHLSGNEHNDHICDGIYGYSPIADFNDVLNRMGINPPKTLGNRL